MKSLHNSNRCPKQEREKKIIDFSTSFCRLKFEVQNARAQNLSHKHQVYHSIIIPSSLTSFKETQKIFVSDWMRACEGGSEATQHLFYSRDGKKNINNIW